MSLAIVRASSARKRQNSGSSALEGIQLIPIHCAPLRFCLSAYVAEVKDVHREGVELETPDLDTIWQTIARDLGLIWPINARGSSSARHSHVCSIGHIPACCSVFVNRAVGLEARPPDSLFPVVLKAPPIDAAIR